MIALVDCNNFYASCERRFRPELNGLPVVVLSNNDGCVIARSEEAKKIGIKMGDPWHLVDTELQKQAHCFSSNYVLYGDMSARMMNNIGRYTPRLEVYSIDESFMDLSGVQGLETYVPFVREQLIQCTGIPVSIGVAPTKTLAKLANKLAKKIGTGWMVLDTTDKITEAVKSFPIDDLWGIGPAYRKKLTSFGIETAGQLREQTQDWMQKHLTIQGVRMWHELWGRTSVPFNETIDRKKGICSSRGFGKYVEDINQLSEAVASHASKVSEKLRSDKSATMLLNVFLLTNPFKKDLPQYTGSITQRMPISSNEVQSITKIALQGLRSIYKPGYKYHKVGVMATGLIPEKELQLNMFIDSVNPNYKTVNNTLDRLNKIYGRGTIRMAAEGYNKKWNMKQEHLSKRYTTRWADIIKVK